MSLRNMECDGREILYRGKVVGYMVSVAGEETYITVEYAKARNIRVKITGEQIDWTPTCCTTEVGGINVDTVNTGNNEKHYSLYNRYGELEMVDMSSGHWWIENVLKTNKESHGVGKAFYKEAERIAKENGAEVIELGVIGVDATLFWKAMGFEVVNYTDTDEEHPCMALMRKKLV